MQQANKGKYSVAFGLGLSTAIVVAVMIYAAPLIIGVELVNINAFWSALAISPIHTDSKIHVANVIENNLSAKIVYYCMMSMPITTFFAVFIAALLNIQREYNGVKHLRGRKIISANQLRRIIPKKEWSNIVFAGVPWPKKSIYQHLLLLGTTGSGKSIAIKNAVDKIVFPDRCIAVDNNFDILRRYYNKKRGDVMLNPLYRGSRSWSILAEIRDVTDMMSLQKVQKPIQFNE